MTLLAIGAHPDDVELGAGGGVAASTAHGRRVVIADLTRGELASAGTPEERAREAAAAASVLGAERMQLGLPDGGLARGDGTQAGALVELIRGVRPELVLAPADGDRHPDHVETHHLVRRAVFLAGLRRHPATGEPHRTPMMLFYASSLQLLDAPTVVVDITAVWDRQQAALDCYTSQLVRGPDDPATPINADGFRSWIAARARACGSLIGVPRGEAYVAGGPLPLVDPFTVLGPSPRSDDDPE